MLLCCIGLMLWNVYVEPHRRQQRLAAQIKEAKGGVTTEAVDTFLSHLFGEGYFIEIVGIDASKMMSAMPGWPTCRIRPGCENWSCGRGDWRCRICACR